MKEKLKEYALFAEIFSAIAILITLSILIIEIRASNELARIAAYDSVTSDFEEWRYSVLSDSENLALFMRSFIGNDLPDIETEPNAASRFQLLLLNDLGIHERAYISYKSGIIGEDEWSRLLRSECNQWASIKNSPYKDILSFRLTDSYVLHLENDC